MASNTETKRGFDPVKALAKCPIKYDLERMLKGFETKEVTADRNEKLVARLRRHRGNAALPLIAKLEGCSATKRRSPEPCLSAACSKCGRAFREWFFDQAHNLMVGQEKCSGQCGVVVTLIAADLIAAPGRLADIDVKAAKAIWWKGVDRLNLPYPMIGGIDVSFNEKASSFEPGYYQVHFAFAVLGHASEEEGLRDLKNKIRSAFKLEPTAHRPLQVRALVEPIKQLSYLYKTLYERRVSIVDSRRGDANVLGLLLKGPQQAEIAAWLDQNSMQDRLLLRGLRRYGTEIVVTA